MEVAVGGHEGLQDAAEALQTCLQRQGLCVLLTHPMPDVAQLLTEKLGLPVHQISDQMTEPKPGHLVIVDADLLDAWAARRLNALDRPATLLLRKDANLKCIGEQVLRPDAPRTLRWHRRADKCGHYEDQASREQARKR